MPTDPSSDNRAYCDNASTGNLVVRAARVKAEMATPKFFPDPLNKRLYNWENSDANPLFGVPARQADENGNFLTDYLSQFFRKCPRPALFSKERSRTARRATQHGLPALLYSQSSDTRKADGLERGKISATSFGAGPMVGARRDFGDLRRIQTARNHNPPAARCR